VKTVILSSYIVLIGAGKPFMDGGGNLSSNSLKDPAEISKTPNVDTSGLHLWAGFVFLNISSISAARRSGIKSNAVFPRWFARFGSAPNFNKSVTASTFPSDTAKCSVLADVRTFAPALSKASTISVYPSLTAMSVQSHHV
jgi:hypothetical protein